MTVQRRKFSSQLATRIERRIRDGVYVAGAPLPSTRELASDFGVSRQVVHEALGSLQERNLLIGKSRIGVFVNPGVLPIDMRQMVLLTHVGLSSNYYHENFHIDSPDFYPQTQLIQRRLPISVTDGPDFWYEIDTIRELRPHCLLVGLPRLRSPVIKRLIKLPFPVVFIGDFHEEAANALPCDQVCESTPERARLLVDAATWLGRRNCVMVGGTLDAWYSRQLRDAAAEHARHLGLRFAYEPYSFDDSVEVEAVTGYIRRIVLERAPRPELLILDSCQTDHLLVEVLGRLGLRVGADIDVLTNFSAIPGTAWLRIDHTRLAALAAETINRLVADPAAHFGRRVFSDVLSMKLLTVHEIPRPAVDRVAAPDAEETTA